MGRRTGRLRPVDARGRRRRVRPRDQGRRSRDERGPEHVRRPDHGRQRPARTPARQRPRRPGADGPGQAGCPGGSQHDVHERHEPADVPLEFGWDDRHRDQCLRHGRPGDGPRQQFDRPVLLRRLHLQPWLAAGRKRGVPVRIGDGPRQHQSEHDDPEVVHDHAAERPDRFGLGCRGSRQRRCVRHGRERADHACQPGLHGRHHREEGLLPGRGPAADGALRQRPGRRAGRPARHGQRRLLRQREWNLVTGDVRQGGRVVAQQRQRSRPPPPTGTAGATRRRSCSTRAPCGCPATPAWR